MKTINIMTSCDGNLMKFIPIQLESIAVNLSDKKVNFFLFHDGTERNFIKILKSLHYDNINFKEVIVEDTDIYDEIAKYGGGWCGAAYYSLCAHKYLPADIDRVWYIDSGDVLIVGNVDEFYYADFEGKSLITASIVLKMEEGKLYPFTKDDLIYSNYLEGISRGLFNSGSYVINLDKMRRSNNDLKEYLKLAEVIYQARGKLPTTFFGDQGFLSLIFIGDIKGAAYPKIVDFHYMPYNFCLWYFERKVQKPDYNPSVIHFVGKNIFKPWFGRYPIFLDRFQDKEKLRNLNELNLGQAEYYYLWHEYAIMTDKRMSEI